MPTAEHPGRRARRQGFTLVELLISVSLLMVVLLLVWELTGSTLALYRTDQARLAANRNARSTLEILGNDVRQSGERFSSDFPAISVSQDSSGNSVLTLRRSLTDAPLPLCAPIPAAAALYVNGNSPYRAALQGGRSNLPDACVSAPQNLTSWDSQIQAGNDRGYIVDMSGSRQAGDFVILTGISSAAGRQSLLTRALPRTAYDPRRVSSSDPGRDVRVYLMEERRYFVQGGQLQLAVNGDPAQAAAPGVLSFTAVPYLKGNPPVPAPLPFPGGKAVSWKSLAYLDLTLVLRESGGRGVSVTRSLTERYTPRNASSADQ